MNDTLTANTQSLSSYRLASSLILSLFEELGFTSENQIDEDALKIKITDILKSTIEKNVTVSSKIEPFPIFINGKEVYVNTGYLSYSDVISLADSPYSSYYSMTYFPAKADGGCILHYKSDPVKITPNGVFSFFHTSNA